MPTRREAFFLAGILLVAGILRFWYAVYLPGTGRDLLHSDMAAYDTAAWSLCQRLPVQGEPGFNGYHPLSASTYNYAGYVYFLACIYAMFGHSSLAVRIVQALIGTATVWLVYALGARIFGRGPGLIAALLTAFYLPLVYYAGFLLSETWFLFLQLAALLLWLAAWDAKTPGVDSVAGEKSGTELGPPVSGSSITNLTLAGFAGLVAGCACISRTAFVPALATVCAAAWCFPLRSCSPRRRAALIFTFLAGAILAIAPVTVRNYQIHGRLILVSTNGPSTFFVGHVLHTPFIPKEQSLPNDVAMADVHRRLNWQYLEKWWPKYLAEIPGFFGDMWFSNEFWPQTTVFHKYDAMIDVDRRSRVWMAVDEPGGPAVSSISFFPDLVRHADRAIWLLIGFPLGVWSICFLPREPRRWPVLYAAILPYMIIPFLAPGFARYRVPAVPLFFILAGQMISVCIGARKQWLQP